MDAQILSTMNGAPLFRGKYYEMWKERMKSNLMETGCDTWFSVVNGYTLPEKVKKVAHKESKKNNSMAMEGILGGLSDPIKGKVEQCKSTK